VARRSAAAPVLPTKELGCGSATTCWRRFDEWAKAGVFEQLQAVQLDELGQAGRINVGRTSVTPQPAGGQRGELTGANSVDRGKTRATPTSLPYLSGSRFPFTRRT